MSKEIPNDVYCPTCGYNLRGLFQNICPECGNTFNPNTVIDSQLPWAHRVSIGRFLAYWKTVRLILRRPSVLAHEIVRPVHYRDAQLFRWVTLLLALAPFVLISIVRGASIGSSLSWTYTVMFNISLLPALIVLTGVASYFFHPRQLSIIRQNRAIALSYYTAAPLALTPVVSFIQWVLWGVWPASANFFALGFMLVLLLNWWVILNTFARGLQLSRGRIMSVVLVLPAISLTAALLTFMFVYNTTMFLLMVYFSLHAS